MAMECKCLSASFLALIFSAILIANGNAAVNIHLCPPSQAYFSSLSIGEAFTVELIAEADPGVTMFAFKVAWTPQGSVSFVRPTSESSSELIMTGFFPQSSPDFSRLSGIAPNWTSQQLVGSSGATPEIAIFTAPPSNRTGPDSLARITFKKLGASYPTFSLTNAAAARHDGGSNSTWLPVSTYMPYFSVDIVNAKMSGNMLSQATAVVVSIAGKDHPASVTGNTWTLDIKTARPSLFPQSLTAKIMRGSSLLFSTASTDIVRSPGWYETAANHSEHPADSDNNGSVDLLDFRGLARCYDSSAGEAKYDFRFDYNADGVVNLFDLRILARNYGR